MDPLKTFKEQISLGLEQAGYKELLMVFKGSGRKVLEMTIERLDAQPVSLKDCVTVTRFLQSSLEVKDPFGFDFSIEVTSPGPKRPLAEEADFERFKDHRIKVVLKEVFLGHKVYEGILKGMEDGFVCLETEPSSPKAPKEAHRLPFRSIKKAHLAPLHGPHVPESRGTGGRSSQGIGRLTKVKKR